MFQHPWRDVQAYNPVSVLKEMNAQLTGSAAQI
jgi:hypothetical protein